MSPLSQLMQHEVSVDENWTVSDITRMIIIITGDHAGFTDSG
jgi:hypothetical protein